MELCGTNRYSSTSRTVFFGSLENFHLQSAIFCFQKTTAPSLPPSTSLHIPPHPSTSLPHPSQPAHAMATLMRKRITLWDSDLEGHDFVCKMEEKMHAVGAKRAREASDRPAHPGGFWRCHCTSRHARRCQAWCGQQRALAARRCFPHTLLTRYMYRCAPVRRTRACIACIGGARLHPWHTPTRPPRDAAYRSAVP